MDKFQVLSILANKLNRMPLNYKDLTGREFETFYTTWEQLQKIVSSIDKDDTIEQSCRSLLNSPLNQLGFKSIATFIDIHTNKSIAILGV